MQLVLTQNVAKLGQAYDIVNVRPGFARNFLLPQNKAVLATGGAVTKAKKVQQERVKKVEELLANAKQLAEKLESITLHFKEKVKGETLYGSLHPKEIVAKLAEKEKIELHKEMVRLKTPIKTLGEHTVTIQLTEEVKATLKVVVEKE